MAYLSLYLVGIGLIWWIYRVGYLQAIKNILSILIPSLLIILFNAKAGRLLFKNPLVGIIAILPTAVLIFKASEPIVQRINSWIDRKANYDVNLKDVVEADVISKEDA